MSRFLTAHQHNQAIQAGKYRTKDKFKRKTIHKLNTTQKKQTMQTTAKNNSGLVASYDTRPRNEVGLFYNAPGPAWGNYKSMSHGD